MTIDCQEMVSRMRAAAGGTPSLRAERKRISREIAEMDRDDVFGLAHHLIAAGVPRFVAYEMVLHHENAIGAMDRAEVERLGEGLGGWADIDAYACFISGPAWRAGRISDRVVRDWACSQDWCWRRVALVSTVPLNSRSQGGSGDTARTLAICRMLIEDRHDLVVKALSWALRELAKRDAKSVRSFLSQHRDQLAPRVVREVTSKLTTGLKHPRR